MGSFFVIWNGIKLDVPINVILLRLNGSAIFKQFKGEGIGFKSFSFQFLSKIELGTCRCWCEGVVELGICWKGFGCCKGMTCFRYSHCNLCLHWIISHSCFWTSDFFYCILMNTYFLVLVSKRIERNFTIVVILLRLKNRTIFIFQDKTEFTIFKGTACKSLTKVELCCDWGYCIVVKFAINWHCDIGCQGTSCCVFSNLNCDFRSHTIIINVCICSSYFTNGVSIGSFFVIWNGIKLDISMNIILLRLNNSAIFKQFKGKGISFKRFSFQFLSEIELGTCRCWCEGIIELGINWKGFGCCKSMTCFRYSHCNLCLHWIISHSCFWTSDFFYSVLMHANFIVLVSKRIEGYFTWRIIGLRLENLTASIFQDKAELTIFKGTACKSLTKVKLRCDWGYNVVIESCIICTSCFTTCWYHFGLGS